MSHANRKLTVHRGTVLAHGLLLELAGLTGQERVARVLAVLEPGDRLLGHEDVVIVRFRAPRPVRCELTLGHVLTEQRGTLRTFAGDEPNTQVAPGSVLWLRAGEVHVIQVHELAALDPRAWLDFGEVTVAQVEPLRRTREEIALVAEPKPLDVRKALGVAALSEEAQAVREGRAAQGGAHAGQKASGSGGFRAFFSALWMRWQQRVQAQRPGSKQGSGREQTGGREQSTGLAKPGLGFELLRRLSHVGLRMMSALGVLWLWLGPQERYLQKLQRLFEQGDTLEALRNALPLGDGKGGAGPARIALAPPKRREELTVSMGRPGPSTVLPVDDDWLAYLRRLYEQAFEKLERAGDVEHAAFVLAELLRDTPRAIQWLEKHGRYRLAAELAESREQPPGECVRLWFLASDVERALSLARRHEAYADAVLRLEKQPHHKAKATMLRLHWANHTAESGDYLEAARIVRAATAEQTAHRLMHRWLELAVGEEGPAAHSAWVMLLALDPSVLPRAHAALAPVIEGDHEDSARDRQRLARELVGELNTPALATLATPLARALVRDCAECDDLPEAELHKLLERAPVVRADWPRHEESLRATSPDLSHRVLALDAGDRGTLRVYDVVALPSGRTLVALGELGVMLLSRTGACMQHWDREPVDTLVPSTRGMHVLTMRRTRAWARLGRLDLATQRHERWLDLDVLAHADVFEGWCWFMSGRKQARLVGLDTLADEPRGLCHVDTDGAIVRMHMSGKHCDLVTYDGAGGLEQWSYELPSLTLRARFAMPPPAAAFALSGPAGTWCLKLEGRPTLEEFSHGRSQRAWTLPATFQHLGDPEVAPELECHGAWATVSQTGAQGVKVDLFRMTDARPMLTAEQRHALTLELRGATTVSVRRFGDTLVTADDLGRVLRLRLDRRGHSLLRV